MLAKWTEILPLFLVRKIASRNCEKMETGGMKFVRARKDVLIVIDGDLPPIRPKNVPPPAPRPPEALRRMHG